MAGPEKTPLWRDDRFLKVAGQAVAIAAVLGLLVLLASNLTRNFQRLGLNFGFGFLFDRERPASFGIGDATISYRPSDPYSRALLVGLLNSLRVMVGGIVLATLAGVTVGLARLSDNWLLRQMATAYVETLRNTPLLLQLFFWYFAVFLNLPKIDSPGVWLDAIFLTNKGIDLPVPAGTGQTWLSAALLAATGALGGLLWRRRAEAIRQQGRAGWGVSLGFLALAGAVLSLLTVGLDWQSPHFDPAGQQIEGGLHLSSEFATLLVGLSAYTAAFIAEVVRAGIQSVPQGQWEAARALGLKPSLAMQLVIFPQGLRLMLPPLTSEYLNLVKNSSLAIAIGYNDIYAISQTISNQTGRALEMLAAVMVTYLTLNLSISLGMNRLNRSVQRPHR